MEPTKRPHQVFSRSLESPTYRSQLFINAQKPIVQQFLKSIERANSSDSHDNENSDGLHKETSSNVTVDSRPHSERYPVPEHHVGVIDPVIHAGPLAWIIGLVNVANGRYLTTEFFSRRAAPTGIALRQKQTWIMESVGDRHIALRNCKGLFLSTDEHGNLRCMASIPSAATQFQIEMVRSSAGDWASCWRFRAVDGAGNLVGDPAGLRLDHRSLNRTDLWYVHLSVHPHAALRNVARNKFVRYTAKEFRTDERAPWGAEALVVIEYRGEGRYAIKASTGQYMCRLGPSRDSIGPDCLFSIEFHKGFVAFRDSQGLYLTGSGPVGTIAGRSVIASKNELYQIEDNYAQISLQASNGRYISAKGIDIAANAISVSNFEIFQLEMEASGLARLRTVKETYWQVHHGSGALQSFNKDKNEHDTEYELEWQADGNLALLAQPSGKYITAKANGHMYASANGVGPNESFLFFIANRPILSLHCPHGYMALKGPDSPKLECNSTTYEEMTMVPGPHGRCYLRASNGKYLHVFEDNTVWADTDPSEFGIAVRGNCTMTVQAPNGKFLRCHHTGEVTADGNDVNPSTLWQFTGKVSVA